MDRKKIGILLIATGKYDQFVDPFIASAKQHLLNGHELHFFMFTDGDFLDDPRKHTIYHTHEPWPLPTLHRYDTFTKHEDKLKKMDYLFYSDVDMKFVDVVGEEILAPITAVLHPGFYNGGGSWGNDINSRSYTAPEQRLKYYAGGFQGGEAKTYLTICKFLANNIEVDKSNGVMAEWHDETHWNWFLSDHPDFLALSPAYCMVEQEHLRKQWGIDHFEPKLVALAKNHEELRNA